MHAQVEGASAAGILYLYAYQATGEKKYLAAVEESFSARSPSDIFLISFLYALTGKDAYRRRLKRAVAALKKIQLPAGCLISDGDYARRNRLTNLLYGLSEVDVRHDAAEPITDQLYVNAKAVLNLYHAYRVTRDRECLEMFFRLMDFLVKIQLHTSDKRLDGAWALNFTNPMSFLCTFLLKHTLIKAVGFCYQVHGSFGVVAEMFGFPPGDYVVE